MTVPSPKVWFDRAAFALLCLVAVGLIALAGTLPRIAGPSLVTGATTGTLSVPVPRAPLAVAHAAVATPEPEDSSEHIRITLVVEAAPVARPASPAPRGGGETRAARSVRALPERPPRA